MRSFLFRIALAILVATPLFAQERTLSWNRVVIDAQLDAESSLHVREEQEILFNGDWNGGERIFEVSGDERFSFKSITRVDEDGRETAMTQGDLSAVDHYRLEDKTLRWRSRLPEDPVFENKVIVYVIRYSIANAVRLVDESVPSFSLSYDFAFPQRSGTIRDFQLALQFDPAWNATPVRLSQANVTAGESVGVNLTLRRSDGSIPAGYYIGTPRTVRLVALTLLLAIVLAAAISNWKYERGTTRWSGLSSEGIDAAFLDEHVFSHAPEVIGAAWDDKTDSAEVAATLARMTQEKKLGTRVESRGRIFKRQVLVMELLADRKSLKGHERALVDAFFEKGKSITDTDAVKERYKHSKSGFDPSEKIESEVAAAVEKIFPAAERKRPRKWPVVLYVIALGAIVLTIAAGFGGGDNTTAAVRLIFISLACALPAGIAAAFHGYLIHRVVRRAIFPLVMLSLLILNATSLLGDAAIRIGLLTVLASVILPGSLFLIVLHHARTPLTAAYVDFRRRLTQARIFLAKELRKENPALDDGWFPYLLAFGLQENVDRWFRSYPAAAARSTSGSGGSSFGSSSSTSTSSSWSGGGGAFGGAGASGAWGVAAAGLASGVAAPSSSSSGSSGGGGSFSSGGGGGGGW